MRSTSKVAIPPARIPPARIPPQIPPAQIPQDAGERYRRDGFFFSPPIIPADLIERVTASMDAVMAGEYETGEPPRRSWNPGDDPKRIRKIDQAHLSDRTIYELASHPAIGRWAAALLGAKRVQLWASQMLYKPPGGEVIGQRGLAPGQAVLEIPGRRTVHGLGRRERRDGGVRTHAVPAGLAPVGAAGKRRLLRPRPRSAAEGHPRTRRRRLGRSRGRPASRRGQFPRPPHLPRQRAEYFGRDRDAASPSTSGPKTPGRWRAAPITTCSTWTIRPIARCCTKRDSITGRRLLQAVTIRSKLASSSNKESTRYE